MAHTKTTKMTSQNNGANDMMISEEAGAMTSKLEKDQYVKSMERRLNIQQEEIQRRQSVIDRLEKELLREKRFKHIEHICENCNQPCVKRDEFERELKKDRDQNLVTSQRFNFKKLTTNQPITVKTHRGHHQTDSSNRYTPNNQASHYQHIQQSNHKTKHLKQSSPVFHGAAASSANPASLKSSDKLAVAKSTAKNSDEKGQSQRETGNSEEEEEDETETSNAAVNKSTVTAAPIVKPPSKRFKPERIEQMNFQIKTEDDPVDDRGIV